MQLPHHYWEKAFLIPDKFQTCSSFYQPALLFSLFWFLPSEIWSGALSFRNLLGLPFLTYEPTRHSIPHHFLMCKSLRLQVRVRDTPGSLVLREPRDLTRACCGFGPRAFCKESLGRRRPVQAGKVEEYNSCHSSKSKLNKKG